MTAFDRQIDVTPSEAMTDVILHWQVTSASGSFPRTIKTVSLLFHITTFIGETHSSLIHKLINVEHT